MSEKKIFRVRLYGDSLALPRKGMVKSEERYIALLENSWREKKGQGCVDIVNRAWGGASVDMLHRAYVQDNSYFELPGDVLIIHSGVVDCAPRPVPVWLREIISGLNWRIQNPVVSFLHNNRSRILRSGFVYVRTEISVFEKHLREFLSHASRNFSRVYVINIAPTNEKIEKHSPGFTSNINKYNEKIRKVVDELRCPSVLLVNIHDYIKSRPEHIDNFVTTDDGHHLTARSHRFIFECIEAEEKIRAAQA